MTPGQPLWQTLLPLVVVGVVLAFRFRSMGRPRPLNPRRLWIQPMVLLAFAGLVIGLNPPSMLGIALCALAAATGGLVGWHRGKLMRIEHDPVTGQLTQSASPAAIVLLIGIIAVRYVARGYFAGPTTPGTLDAHALLVTDVLLSFAITMLSATRVEMGLRARAIIAEAASVDPTSG